MRNEQEPEPGERAIHQQEAEAESNTRGDIMCGDGKQAYRSGKEEPPKSKTIEELRTEKEKSKKQQDASEGIYASLQRDYIR
jgi:hypothetical protein